MNVLETPAQQSAPQSAPSVEVAATPDNQLLELSSANILINQQILQKNVLRILQNMLALGYVNSDYYEALLGRENKVNTYMCNGIAIPHGTNEAKGQVSKTGVVIMQLPKGVVWGSSGEKAHFVVGIAAKGDDHMTLLQQLATVAMEEELAQTLGTKASVADIIKALGDPDAADTAQAEEVVAEAFDIEKECKVVDVAGIHARPASGIARVPATIRRLSSTFCSVASLPMPSPWPLFSTSAHGWMMN